MQQALVTGGTGFIGSHLVRQMVSAGTHVTLLIRPTSDASVFSDISHKIEIKRHDNSYQSISDCFTHKSFDAVFHLATQFIAEHSPDDLNSMLEANIAFGTKVANAATEHGVKHFINTSSNWQYYHSKTYRPLNLYAAMKQGFEDILAYYADAKGLKVANVILFDTYGENDTRKKLVPLLLAKKLTGRTLELSRGDQMIDLTHVSKVIDALLTAKERLKGEQKCFHRFIASSSQSGKLRDVITDFCIKKQIKVNLKWGAKDYREREVFDICIYDEFENLIND